MTDQTAPDNADSSSGFVSVPPHVGSLTIEPKISAKAVDVNPAVCGAGLLGAGRFGAVAAFPVVPVVALLLALLDIYVKCYDLVAELPGSDKPADSPMDRGRASAAASSSR